MGRACERRKCGRQRFPLSASACPVTGEGKEGVIEPEARCQKETTA